MNDTGRHNHDPVHMRQIRKSAETDERKKNDNAQSGLQTGDGVWAEAVDAFPGQCRKSIKGRPARPK